MRWKILINLSRINEQENVVLSVKTRGKKRNWEQRKRLSKRMQTRKIAENVSYFFCCYRRNGMEWKANRYTSAIIHHSSEMKSTETQWKIYNREMDTMRWTSWRQSNKVIRVETGQVERWTHTHTHTKCNQKQQRKIDLFWMRSPRDIWEQSLNSRIFRKMPTTQPSRMWRRWSEDGNYKSNLEFKFFDKLFWNSEVFCVLCAVLCAHKCIRKPSLLSSKCARVCMCGVQEIRKCLQRILMKECIFSTFEYTATRTICW